MDRNHTGILAGSQAPAWEPIVFKLQLEMFLEAGASKAAFPSWSLGTSKRANEQTSKSFDVGQQKGVARPTRLLFIMGPHAIYFDCLIFLNDLVD